MQATPENFQRRFSVNTDDCIAGAHAEALGLRSALDRDDDRSALYLTHGEADADGARVLPVKLFVGRAYARVSVAQVAYHSSQDCVKRGGARRFGGQRAKDGALGLPVNAVKSRVVVTLMNRFPNVVEDREPSLARLRRNAATAAAGNRGKSFGREERKGKKMRDHGHAEHAAHQPD